MRPEPGRGPRRLADGQRLPTGYEYQRRVYGQDPIEYWRMLPECAGTREWYVLGTARHKTAPFYALALYVAWTKAHRVFIQSPGRNI